VLVDNGRSALLGTPAREILRCIRCSACLNHCPVYTAVGGHAYGSVYSGPMGAVLTPALAGVGRAAHLPQASTLCGRCESVCPVGIPLSVLLRNWREQVMASSLAPAVGRFGLRAWAWLGRHPWLYRLVLAAAARVLRAISVPAGTQGRRRVRRLPFATGWISQRDLPAPDGETFQARWRRERLPW
jgi:L-lactate dehydrogenase complex protein LldF